MDSAYAYALEPAHGHEAYRSWSHSVSGVRPRWYAERPSETLAAATCLVASSLGVAREGDEVSSVGMAVGTSPLRAAAWLRARGAAVGHASSRSRLMSAEGSAYDIASRTIISRSTAKTALTFAEIRSSRIAQWIDESRVAIVMVGPSWPSTYGSEMHALVVVASRSGSLTVFDPAGDGSLLELSLADMDRLRAEPGAAWEVLLAARRG